MSTLSDLVARYLRLREIGKNLNSKLVQQLPGDVLNEGGRELGFLRKNIFVFENEDESSILMDYCLYNVPRQGRNMVQDFLARFPPPEGSDEWLHLQAMTRAWYSIWVVEEVLPGAGIRARDLFRQSDHLLLDIGFSRSASPGAMFASRVIPHDGMIMTTGAGLPLGGGAARKEQLITRLIKVFFTNNIASLEQLTCKQEKDLARTIITTALSWGASSRIQYQDPDQQERTPHGASEQRRPIPVATGGRVGRNDPCPCGSGKKYKKCCGGH